MENSQQVPVTVLTGFLGAGKTTLLNRILTEQHGRKYAVIVNEFGEQGIDNDLVVDADEEVFEMNNGSIKNWRIAKAISEIEEFEINNLESHIH